MNYLKLKDLSEPKKGMYGIGASAVEFNAEYPRYLRITDIKEDSTIPSVLPTCIDPSKYKKWQSYIIKTNDIVFARTGSIGRNYFCEKPTSTTVFAGYLVKFSINSDIVVPKYVGYYCQSKPYWNQIKSLVSGTVMPQINATKYGESLVIPIISRTQQHT